MILAALLTFADLPAGRWKDLWSTGWVRMEPHGPPNHRAQVAWFRRGDGSIGDVKLSFFTTGESPDYLCNSQVIGSGYRPVRVEVFALPAPATPKVAMSLTTPFVVIDARIKGRLRSIVRCYAGGSWRPYYVKDLNQCDTSLFVREGILLEFTSVRNLPTNDKPAGASASSLAVRTWTFDQNTFRLNPRKWRLIRNRLSRKL